MPTASVTGTRPSATARTDTTGTHSSGATAFLASMTLVDPTQTANQETTVPSARADQGTKETLTISSVVVSLSLAARALVEQMPNAPPGAEAPSANAPWVTQVTPTRTASSILAQQIPVVKMPSAKLRVTRPSANAHPSTLEIRI